MFAEEWPLMMFTIVSQLAVGTFIMLIAIDIFSRKKGNKVLSKAISHGLVAVWLLMGLSLIFSLFHLGTPMGAYRTISNFATSWLSREIVFAGLFFFMTFVSLYLYKKEKSTSQLLGIITAIIGLLVIYSMASLYSSSIRPAWDHLNTYITFYGTTILFGIMGSTLIVSRSLKDEPTLNILHRVLKKGSILAAIVVIIQLGYLPVYMSNLSNGGVEAQASFQILTQNYRVFLGLKWLLSIIGTLLLLYVFFKQKGKLQVGKRNLLFMAFLAVFAGEFIGRYIFYATGVSIGIG